MTEKEIKDCLLAASILNSINRLAFCLVFTLPFWGYCFFIHSQNMYVVFISSVGILSGIFIGFRAWHLYFDAQLFKSIAAHNLSLDNVDSALHVLFNKKSQAKKDIDTRIHACYKMARVLILTIALHLLLLIVTLSVLETIYIC